MRQMRALGLALALVLAATFTVAAPASADPLNANAHHISATCTTLGDVELVWLLYPTPNARGGSSALQVVGSNTVVIVYTGATERIGPRDGTTCTFWAVDGSPITPPLTEWVIIVPRPEPADTAA